MGLPASGGSDGCDDSLGYGGFGMLSFRGVPRSLKVYIISMLTLLFDIPCRYDFLVPDQRGLFGVAGAVVALEVLALLAFACQGWLTWPASDQSQGKALAGLASLCSCSFS